MKPHLSRLIASTVLTVLALPQLAHAQQDPIGRFEIVRYDIQGNTLLTPQQTDQLLAPFTGKQRSFGDVQQAVEALEGAYQKLGYNVVQVVLPEQELNQGVVRVRVIQPRLARVRVEGQQFFDEANIRRSLPGLREGETPNIGKISSSLKLANENPVKKTNLQLHGGSSENDIDATVKVIDDKPWRVGAVIDNTGNPSTGETQINAIFQHANVANLDHVVSLQYTTSVEHPSKVSVYGAGYHIPLYALGESIDLFASYSEVNSSVVLAGIFDLPVTGEGSVFGVRYNQNLRRRGDYESKLIYGLDYKAYKNSITDDVTVHPLSIGYLGTWTPAKSEVNFSATAFHNIPGGDKGGTADFNRVRFGAPSVYNIVRYGASYSRALPNDWLARVSMTGQYTNDELVPGEQFGIGGASSVRGFQEREVSNDSGYVINAEVYTPNLCGGIQAVAAQCRALAFYDMGRVSRNNPLPGEIDKASIGSIGVGLRMNIGKTMSLQVDYGHVVDAGITTGKGDDRVHFRLGLSY
ncbi:ShlB/FhaC/HecB family hemolysin secretion/activation protein [Noviherbaspirillum cavernae]|uniref:ShlB/FhaC/HecB family hemolysin secretion/activation protein n=1 Tax=Noviherbaspirillum cavernae TaxID=2320862 RepID=A0A418X2Y2_9BURK|nr:ShlB/FhaC/HecB family hemolysin secretion/activation protein [Noviherbaspirillum cavernae]RJG06809.1 ShlB/FhaC/HecB family hemolysin secretion/activation protein [Noviherbaspirillum cavernae]